MRGRVLLRTPPITFESSAQIGGIRKHVKNAAILHEDLLPLANRLSLP